MKKIVSLGKSAPAVEEREIHCFQVGHTQRLSHSRVAMLGESGSKVSISKPKELSYSTGVRLILTGTAVVAFLVIFTDISSVSSSPFSTIAKNPISTTEFRY